MHGFYYPLMQPLIPNTSLMQPCMHGICYTSLGTFKNALKTHKGHQKSL